MVKLLGSPIGILAVSIAYLIEADSHQTFEEKAKLVTVFGKHVSRKELTQEQLQAILGKAFDHTDKMDVDDFLNQIAPKLTPGQKTSIVLNMYDAMLVDGQVAAGERSILNKFIGAFDLSRDTMRAVREMMMLKNDTGIFTDKSHPYNEPKYVLDLKMFSQEEAEDRPQLTDAVAGVKENWKKS